MPRTRLPLPAGQGLDRASGTLVVDPSTYAELENVLVREGRFALRLGLGTAVQTLAGPSQVCHLAFFEEAAKLLLVTYTAATRAVDVYAADLAGNTPTLLGTWGTLPNGAIEPPRFSHAQMWGKLLLAHFEPNVLKRLVTKHTNGSILTTLTANLDGTGAKNALFAWVREHLGYIAAGAFGSDSDKDRPEVVRLSSATDPTVFEAGSYVLAGARGSIAIAGQPCSAGFLILKAAEAHLLTGTDKSSFTINPVDRTFGVVTHRAAVVVGGTVYAWTHRGPMRTATGYFEPLHLPLELTAALPAGYPNNMTLGQCHAAYDPDEEVIRWFFPDYATGTTVAVLLTLRGGFLRWSYERYPLPIACAARVAPSAESAIVGAGYASAVSHSGVQTGATYQTKATFTLNSYVGDEQVEVWARQGAAAYTKLTTVPINTSTATQSVQFALPAAGSWDVAVRFTRAGAPRADHADPDPALWPAAARATGTVTALPALTVAPPTYTPGATMPDGTWGVTWGTPTTGAFVKLYLRSLVHPWQPTTDLYQHNNVLVHTSAVDATGVSGLSVVVLGSTIAGRIVSGYATQHLTVNGIAGYSPNSAYSASVAFTLAEAPGAGVPAIDTITSQVAEPPGTSAMAHWTHPPSQPAASGGTVEVYALFTNGGVQLNWYTTSITEQQVVVVAPPSVSCATRGAGSYWTLRVWVRYALTIAGVTSYTNAVLLDALPVQVCQL